VRELGAIVSLIRDRSLIAARIVFVAVLRHAAARVIVFLSRPRES
jgi:hypothetical protein